MNGVFACPRCAQPLGDFGMPGSQAMTPCPSCGWRAVAPVQSMDWAGWLLWPLLLGAAGLAAGGVIAHSLYLVIISFVGLGPLAAARIARWLEGGWWLSVLLYAVGLGAGVYLLSDGVTVAAHSWIPAASAASFTAVAGLLSGLFQMREH